MNTEHAHNNADAGEVAEKSAKVNFFNKTVLAWSLWDWGSAAFNAVATTFVFSVYLTSGLFADTDTSSQALSLGLTIAGFIIALLAPITGQRADRRGKGTLWLGFNTYVVVMLTGMMFFVHPESAFGPLGAMWLGIALLGAGNVFFEFASVNYNAMLARVSTPKTMGRVSGLGWGLGYVGGIILLLILYVGFIAPEVGWFGVTSADGMNVRVAMVIAALWFGLSALPVLIAVPGRKVEGADEDGHESLLMSYKLLWHTVKGLWKSSPHTIFFLIASAIFRDGLAGVFTFGAIIAAGTFGFTPGEVMIFGIVANVVAGIATISFGALDDKIGPKAVIVISLVSMVVDGILIFIFHDAGSGLFWVLGLGLTVFVGPCQSASRTFLARLIPEGREGEVFGLYATTGRAVSFLAPMFFGLSVRLGSNFVPEGASSQYWGILGIVLILLLGLVLIIPVKSARAHLDSFKD